MDSLRRSGASLPQRLLHGCRTTVLQDIEKYLSLVRENRDHKGGLTKATLFLIGTIDISTIVNPKKKIEFLLLIMDQAREDSLMPFAPVDPSSHLPVLAITDTIEVPKDMFNAARAQFSGTINKPVLVPVSGRAFYRFSDVVPPFMAMSWTYAMSLHGRDISNCEVVDVDNHSSNVSYQGLSCRDLNVVCDPGEAHKESAIRVKGSSHFEVWIHPPRPNAKIKVPKYGEYRNKLNSYKQAQQRKIKAQTVEERQRAQNRIGKLEGELRGLAPDLPNTIRFPTVQVAVWLETVEEKNRNKCGNSPQKRLTWNCLLGPDPRVNEVHIPV